MYMRQRTKINGFTLIEVLIALVVAVVGILAIIQLSGAFLKTASESEQRTVAYALAERTIEDLRAFDNLSGSTAGESYFENLVTGSLANVSVSSGQSSYLFSINWTVSDNIVSGGVVSPGASGAIYRTLKEVDIVVSWTQPEAGSVSLSSFIGGVDPNANALVDDVSNVGGSEPDVGYTPGVAPEVIAVDVADGKLKETTKPLPEVTNKSQSTQVRFETITYTNTNTEIQLIQEDFVTVNCRCVLDTAGGSIVAPSYQKFEGIDSPLTEVIGDTVSGATGTPASLSGGKIQSDFCGRCCANHHDTSSSSIKYSPSAGAASTGSANTLSHNVDHPHYRISDDTSEPLGLTEALHGEEYLEACRFKRIDGIYRLIQDWELREVNVFPKTYLDTSNSAALADYVEYIKDFVKYEIYHKDLPAASVAAAVSTATAAPSLSVIPSLELTSTGNDESLSRSIYLDDIMSVEGLADYLITLSAASVAEDTWLEFIPFNEINTTQLTKWNSTSTAVATVTDQPVAESYSRGHIYAVAIGSASVAASAAQGNTGILGNTYNAENIYPDQDNRITPTRSWLTGTYNPMDVTVSGAGSSPSVYSLTISGSVTVIVPNVAYKLTCTDSSYTATLVETGNNFVCTISDIPTGVSANATVTISTKKNICLPASTPYSYTYNTNASVTGVSFEVSKNACP